MGQGYRLAYEKAHQKLREETERPLRVKVSTLPFVNGKSLGYVSVFQKINISTLSPDLKIDDNIIQALQVETDRRGGNFLSNLKINYIQDQGQPGILLAYGSGESMLTSAYEMSIAQPRTTSPLKSTEDDASPELKEILRILNGENVEKTLPTLAVMLGGVYKKSVEVHNKAIELQAVDKGLSYEIAVRESYTELVK